MKTKKAIIPIVTFLCGTVLADRPLDKAEISQILQNLTSQPLKTWISSGTISATHEEYRAPRTTNAAEISNRIDQAIQEHQNDASNAGVAAEIVKMKLDAIPFNVRYWYSNEHTMSTNETLTFDGSRFRWNIKVNWRTDSVRPGPELNGNFMTEHFNLAYNRERTFIWDSQQYTLQSNSNDSSFVDAGNQLPHAVNGPLTAGITPWGYGEYTYANLAALPSSAVEKDSNGRSRIHLTLDKPDGSRMVFVLDADDNYAVTSYTTEGLYETISRDYGAYQSVAGRSVPTVIEIEKRDAVTNGLLARDSWHITSIDTSAPSAGDFTTRYAEGAQIEYSSAVAPNLLYSYSSRLDTDLLLAERLAYATSQDGRTKNCATAALRYAALRLGRNISRTELSQLVDRQTGQTSLLAMKEFVYRQGLYCRAVRTDIRTLQGLTDCQVILHIPHKNHFVLLGDIDSQSLWTIDLTGRNFCSRADVGFFGMDWMDGTALLISDAPIAGAFDDIGSGELASITGGAGWSCTKLLQNFYYEKCPDLMGECFGSYIYEPERFGCEQSESGLCINSGMLSRATCPCIEDPLDPTACIVNGDWNFQFMSACK